MYRPLETTNNIVSLTNINFKDYQETNIKIFIEYKRFHLRVLPQT